MTKIVGADAAGSFNGVRRPGRPGNQDHSHVPEDIIEATEKCLEHKSPQEISAKEIALAAGTRPAMVYYYFGSKEGLVVEIIRRYLGKLQAGLIETRDLVRSNPGSNPTRLLLAEFAKVYNLQPRLFRILISETFREDSEVLVYLLRQNPAFGKVTLASVIAELSLEGHYRNDLDVEKVCMLINSVVLFPLILKPYFKSRNDPACLFLDDDWMDFISSVLDGYLHK